jgi:hypothetical protein
VQYGALLGAVLGGLLGASVKERAKHKLFYVHEDVLKVQFEVNGCHYLRLGDCCALCRV